MKRSHNQPKETGHGGTEHGTNFITGQDKPFPAIEWGFNLLQRQKWQLCYEQRYDMQLQQTSRASQCIYQPIGNKKKKTFFFVINELPEWKTTLNNWHIQFQLLNLRVYVPKMSHRV